MSARRLNRKVIRALTALGVLALTVALHTWRSYDRLNPFFEGKRLSAWLDEVYPRTFINDSAQAVLAVRAIGTNALPYLMQELRRQNSIFADAALALNSRQTWIELPATPKHVRIERAMTGFRVLGKHPGLAQYVPEFEKMLNGSGDDPVNGTDILGMCGDRGRSGLLRALKHHQRDVQAIATQFLSEWAPSDVAVRHALIHSATNGSWLARIYSIEGLARCTNSVEEVLPILLKSLDDRDPYVQGVAAEALGNFGANASAALPRLERLVREQPKLTNAALTLERISLHKAAELEKE